MILFFNVIELAETNNFQLQPLRHVRNTDIAFFLKMLLAKLISYANKLVTTKLEIIIILYS